MKKHLSTALLAALMFFGGVGIAEANPSSFATGTTTSVATTSPAYMTPGTGTSTTPVYDAYAQTFNGGITSKADKAGLLVQFTASSTSSVLTAAIEYSQDGIDWYRNYVTDPNQNGTTTPSMAIGAPVTLSWTFASSSVGGAGVQRTNNRSTAAVLIPTPFRYTRAVFSITGANGAVWAQLVPIKERP